MEEQTKHRIIQLTAENIKKLKAVSLSIKDGLTVIAGRNGQGKTSLLDALMFLMMGKRHPDLKLLREGELKGFVEAETDDLIFKRTITAGGGGTLTIKPKEGTGPYNGPQGFLDEITGRGCFDPLAFMRLPSKAQAIQLRELVGLDFTEMDADIHSAYTERTDVNRDVKHLQGLIEKMACDQTATERMDPAPIREKIKGIDVLQHRATTMRFDHTKAENEVERQEEAIRYAIDRIQQTEKELARFKNALKEAQDDLDQKTQVVARAKVKMDDYEKAVPDQAELFAELEKIQIHNLNVDNTNAWKEKRGERDAFRRASDELTRKIEKMERSKAEALKEANFPIDGLAFTGEGVTYQGMPLSQASGAEQIRVAVAVSAAMNPALPVMIVKDGSLLDADSMKLIAELAEERGLQIIMERIERDDFVSIVIEDGEIVDSADASNAVTDQGTLTL